MTARFETAKAEHVAVLRIAVYGIWLVLLMTTDFAAYPSLPSGLFEGKGIASFLPLDILFSSPRILQVIWWGAIVGCALSLIGFGRFQLIGATTAPLIFLLDAGMKSLGSYANHAQVVPLLLVFILPMFPAAEAFSLNRRKTPGTSVAWRYSAPMLISAAVMTLTYSFIGARRLMVGGLNIYRNGSLERWIVARTLEDNAFDFEVGLAILDHRWLVVFLALGMFAVTIFEILSPLALRYERFRQIWLVVIIAFHVSTLFGMNILFWENLVLLIVLFTRVPQAIAARFERIRKQSIVVG